MANYTSVVASNICDAAGNKLASGTVSFQATDAANQPLNFQVGGGGQVVTTPATATITAGVVAGGFQVADSASTSPAGVLYRITITDSTLNRVVVTYSLVTVTGATFNLDTYTPSGASVLPPVGGNVNGPLTVTGNLSVTGSFNPGTLGNVTSTGTVLAKTIGGFRYANQFAGADIGAQVNAAIADLPAAPVGGTVYLPSGVSTFSTPIVFDRPVSLKGCGSSFNSSGGTTLRWSGGASVTIQITNIYALGSVLEGFSLDNTGTGTIGIDIDNSQYYTTLRNVFVVPSVAFSVAGVRIGNTSLCPLTHFFQTIIAGNVIGVQILKATDTTFYGGGIYGNSTSDVQLGNATSTAFVTSFFGTEIESTANNITSVNVLNAQGVYFHGVYTELNGATGLFLNIPNTAIRADNISFNGIRAYGNTTATAFLAVNLSTATISIEHGWFSGFSSATLITNTSARHIWTNDLNTDSTVSGIVSSTANYNAGPNSLNGAMTSLQIGDNVGTALFSAQFRRSGGAGGSPDIIGNGTNALVIGGKSDGSGTVGFGTTTTVEIGSSGKLQGAGGGAVPMPSASFTRSGGAAGFPDAFGDGTHALVIGGKSDGSGSVAFGTTTSVSVTGGLTTNTEVLTAAAPTVSAGQVGLGSTTATSATAGANGAVPAQVVGYLIINVAGTNVKVPYYNT